MPKLQPGQIAWIPFLLTAEDMTGLIEFNNRNIPPAFSQPIVNYLGQLMQSNIKPAEPSIPEPTDVPKTKVVKLKK